MSDDNDNLEEGEEFDTLQAPQTICFPWEGGDVVVLDINEFSAKFETLAVRSLFKTGELEVLSKDGKSWRKLGRHLKAVESK